MSGVFVGLWSWDWAHQVFTAILGFFERLMDATGTKPLYFAMFLACLAFRLLAAPFMGAALHAGSDAYSAMRAKKLPHSDSKEIARYE